MFNGPTVTMVSDNTPPGSNTAKVVVADLAKIGFKVKNISVLHQTMYSKFCSVSEANEPNICPNVGWLAGLQGSSDAPRHTVQRQEHRAVEQQQLAATQRSCHQQGDRRCGKADRTKARAEAWGKIDKMVTLSAAAIPWDLGELPDVVLFTGSSGDPTLERG